MSHARIEEVADSDDAVSDPSEGDVDDFDDTDILMRKGDSSEVPRLVSSSSSSTRQTAPPVGAQSHLLNPADMQQMVMQQQQHHHQHHHMGQPDMSKYCDYQHLYPVYFDASRSRAEGRRVSKGLAVNNPLAREIVNACARLRLDTLFEPGKTHPKDWANPGRVRVGFKESPLWGEERGIKNKHHLYVLVAQHLRENPTTEDSPSLRVRVQGAPLPDTSSGKGWPRPNVPKGKGWKMGELLPHYSPALTGGGVSENLFKDMMKEMQASGGPGGMPPGMGDMAEMLQGFAGPSGAGGVGGEDSGAEKGGKKKKDKKKK